MRIGSTTSVRAIDHEISPYLPQGDQEREAASRKRVSHKETFTKYDLRQVDGKIENAM